MKHIAKRLLSLLLVVCLVLSVAVIPAGAAETKLTSVYASYAAEGHTNAPIEDDVFEAKSDSITVSIMTTTDLFGYSIKDHAVIGKLFFPFTAWSFLKRKVLF